MYFTGVKPSGVRPRINYGHPHAQGMAAFYLFDAGGGLTVYDAFSGRTGTLNNGPTWLASSAGNGSNGLNFSSASSQYVDLGTPSGLDFAGGSMSVAASVYYPTRPNFSNFIIYNKGSQAAFDVEGPSNRFRFYVNNGGSGALWSEGATATNGDRVTGGGAWNIVNTTGYAVGEGKTVVTSSAPFGSMPSSSSNVRIGSTSAGGSYFNGAINWVAVWGKAISSDVMIDFQRNPFACLVPSITRFPFIGASAPPGTSFTAASSISLGSAATVTLTSPATSFTASSSISLGSSATVTQGIGIAAASSISLGSSAAVTLTTATTFAAESSISLGSAAAVTLGSSALSISAASSISLGSAAQVTIVGPATSFTAASSISLGSAAAVTLTSTAFTVAAASSISLGSAAAVQLTTATTIAAASSISLGAAATVTFSTTEATRYASPETTKIVARSTTSAQSIDPQFTRIVSR